MIIVFCDGGGSGEREETFTEARSADAGGAAEIDGVSFTPHRRRTEERKMMFLEIGERMMIWPDAFFN